MTEPMAEGTSGVTQELDVPEGDSQASPAGEAGPASGSASVSDEVSDEVLADLEEAMRDVVDPELGINVVDLGLVYACDVTRQDDGTRTAAVKLTLTAPGCGMGEVLVQDAKDKLLQIPTLVSADVEIVFDPPWDREMMSEAARLQTGMM